jgi:hypothetical protein
MAQYLKSLFASIAMSGGEEDADQQLLWRTIKSAQQ